MSKETLKSLRIIIPGIIILVLTIPLFQSNLNLDSFTNSVSALESGLYIGIAVILGAIYYISNARDRFIRKPMLQIQQNIKEKLLEPFTGKKSVEASKANLMQGRKLMQIFYELVDNSETLKEKAKNVHLNGLLLSTSADLTVLLLLFSLIYFAFYFVYNNLTYVALGLIALDTSLYLYFVLTPKLTWKHIELSNEQLEFIQAHLRDKLSKLIGQATK